MNGIQVIRTRFATDIVAEVAIPRRKSQKVIIVAPGMPGSPSKKDLIEFLAGKGYWAISMRYRGTWESGGEFLKKSPEQDILDIIDDLDTGFTDLWSGDTLHLPSSKPDSGKAGVKPQQIYVIGISFGGPAALLVSRDTRIHAVVAVSPVVDWREPSKAEPLDWLKIFVKQAFGEGYRFTGNNWRKLARGAFYNPVRHIKEIHGEKVLILHAKDDESVLYKPVEVFSRETGARLKLYKRGGHLSSSFLMKPRIWRQVERFFGVNH